MGAAGELSRKSLPMSSFRKVQSFIGLEISMAHQVETEPSSPLPFIKDGQDNPGSQKPAKCQEPVMILLLGVTEARQVYVKYNAWENAITVNQSSKTNIYIK